MTPQEEADLFGVFLEQMGDPEFRRAVAASPDGPKLLEAYGTNRALSALPATDVRMASEPARVEAQRGADQRFLEGVRGYTGEGPTVNMGTPQLLSRTPQPPEPVAEPLQMGYSAKVGRMPDVTVEPAAIPARAGPDATSPPPPTPVAASPGHTRTPPGVGGLEEAQARASEGELFANLARAGSMATAALSGGNAPVDTRFYEGLSRQAKEPVTRYQEQVTERERLRKESMAAAARDPNSSQSKAVQGYVEKTFPGLYTPEELAQITAADAELALEPAKMRAQMKGRMDEQAAQNSASMERTKVTLASHEKEGARNRAAELEKARIAAGAQGDMGKVGFQRSSDLRKELSGNPVTKAAQTVAAAYDKIRRVTSGAPSAAGDISLVYGFMKINDPDSSVREGEFATAQNAGGVPDRIRAAYNKLLSGERLSDDVRADFVRRSGDIAGAQMQRYKQLSGQYSELATRAGVDPKDVVLPIDIDLTKPQKRIERADPATGEVRVWDETKRAWVKEG